MTKARRMGRQRLSVRGDSSINVQDLLFQSLDGHVIEPIGTFFVHTQGQIGHWPTDKPFAITKLHRCEICSGRIQ